MQKVGMSDREIRGTIRRQILLVFFVPVLGAVLHTCAGLVMVGKLFEVLGFFDMVLLKMCAAGVILVFAGFYGASYVATARTYYGIVSRK
jgi:putative ABC transport system permease protein